MNCLNCGAPVKKSKTKPSRYCSTTCKNKWHRLEAKVFAATGADTLVAAVEKYFAVAGSNDREAQLAALTALASHRLIRWLPPLEVQADGLRYSSSSTGGEPAPAPSLAAGPDDSISAEIARQQNEALRIVTDAASKHRG